MGDGKQIFVLPGDRTSSHRSSTPLPTQDNTSADEMNWLWKFESSRTLYSCSADKFLPTVQTRIFIGFRVSTSNLTDTECWLHSHFNGLHYYSQLIELWLNKSPNQVTKQDALPAYERRQQDVTFTYVRLVIIRRRCHVPQYWVVWFDRSWCAKILILVLITF